jgi:hypothetical protein
MTLLHIPDGLCFIGTRDPLVTRVACRRKMRRCKTFIRFGICWKCNEQFEFLRAWPGHDGPRLRRWKGSRCTIPLPTRSTKTNSSGTSSSGALVPGLLSAYPELWDFLTVSSLPDGTRRLTGRLSVTCERGVITVSLSDDETNQFVSRSGKSLDDCLKSAEAGMASGELEWAVSKYPTKRKR